MSSATIVRVPVGHMMNIAYLIGDDVTKTCAVVDPGWNAQEILEAAGNAGWTITGILLTHAHFDHTNALEALAKNTGATTFVHRAELGDLPKELSLVPTEEGTVIDIGRLQVRCLHTPGHTPGSQCFLVEQSLLTGDTLFVDGCGRVDLPGSHPADMIVSLKRLAALDPNITLYPGHDYGSAPTATIGDQRRRNPYLGAISESQLL